ncbi:MAG: anaerobic carbon-monoxide dehydrogenase catalytic subunit [Nitrososphaerales archaeon]
MRREKVSGDPATVEMFKYASSIGLETVFHRQAKYDEKAFVVLDKYRCWFGAYGICCFQCLMGPCRLWDEDMPYIMKAAAPYLNEGTCGISRDSMVARNLLMRIVRGTAAHAGHAKHMAMAFLKAARGEVPYTIKDADKLRDIAGRLGINVGHPLKKVAEETALTALQDIVGVPADETRYMQFLESYLPKKLVESLKKLGVFPRSIGEEVMIAEHEAVVGMMNDPVALLKSGVRLGLADHGALLIATEIADIMFGKPNVLETTSGIGVLAKDKVNIVIHGHNALLSSKIVDLADDEGIVKEAKAVRADGINVVGNCCTGAEVLMRYGIPLAGNNLQQALLIATGLVDAMVVDIQCIYPSIGHVAQQFHTKLITTMEEARMPEAEHIPFTYENADEAAKKILMSAILNFERRKPERIFIPPYKPQKHVGGFSAEGILAVLSKINREDPLKPLIDNIVEGNIYGIALLASCTSPKVSSETTYVTIAKKLLKSNVLILASGCAAGACSRVGLVNFEATEEFAGEKLKGVLKALGKVAGIGKPLPPVIHIGPCVDNSRAVILASALAEKLGVSISDLPVVVSASELITEKAVAIGTGAVAMGFTVHIGITSPVVGSDFISKFLTDSVKDMFGGRFILEIDPEKASDLMYQHIAEKRKALNLAVA